MNMNNEFSRGFVFDLNGTMVNDMEFHTKAWYDVLNHVLKAGLSWEEVKVHMYGKNEELLVRIFGADRFSEEEKQALSLEKEKRYRAAFLPHLKLINGLEEFLKKADDQHIKMAVGTAAINSNIDFVLDNLHIRQYFDAVVGADNVTTSKPHPETFLKAADLIKINPKDCIVFEDVPKGVETALNAGMQAVVITTMHAQEEFSAYPNVLAFINDYTDPYLNKLLHPDFTAMPVSHSV